MLEIDGDLIVSIVHVRQVDGEQYNNYKTAATSICLLLYQINHAATSIYYYILL